MSTQKKNHNDLPDWLTFRRSMPTGARWSDGTKYRLANPVMKVGVNREIKSTVLLDFKGDLFIKDLFHTTSANGEKKPVICVIKNWYGMECLDLCRRLLDFFGADPIMSDLTSIIQRWYVEQEECGNPFMANSLKKL